VDLSVNLYSLAQGKKKYKGKCLGFLFVRLHQKNITKRVQRVSLFKSQQLLLTNTRTFFYFFLYHQMELALSLGDSPKPYAFLDKTTKISNKDLGFCMGLGSGSGGRSDEKTDSRDGEGRRREVIRDEGERRRVSSDPPLQLELLPFSPVPRSQPPTQLRFPWLTDNCKYPLPPPPTSTLFFFFFFYLITVW
jgi:hypothetical protein